MPKVLTYYKVDSVPDHPQSVKISKFDEDLAVQSSYVMNFLESKTGGYWDCPCPAVRFDCRHKSILKSIQDAKKVDSGQFFCFETKSFHNLVA